MRHVQVERTEDTQWPARSRSRYDEQECSEGMGEEEKGNGLSIRESGLETRKWSGSV